MSRLHFVFGTMKSGKTMSLLAEAHNFRSCGRNAFLMTAAADTRSGHGRIASRIGISSEAHAFSAQDNLFDVVMKAHSDAPIDIVMIDESQFMSRDQVFQISDVVDTLGISVTCYGLRTDFRGELFEGSAALMAIADSMSENTGVCRTGAVANMVLRVDPNGDPIVDGPQVLVGGEETYEAVCRREWKRRMSQALNAQSRIAI